MLNGMWPLLVSLLSVGAWLYLLLGRDGFWRARPRIEEESVAAPEAWPPLVVVVPARDEAEHVESALQSLLRQDYPGDWRIILVDDHSADATGAIVERMARASEGRLEVVAARALPAGWSGKLWAIAEGLRGADEVADTAPYVLLTDADIGHPQGNLRRLVAKAEGEGLDLVSLMVRLHCRTFWERALIPAFVFFFQKLYPFPAVNDRGRREAAAAGGCMLVRRDALRQAGGIERVRDRLIDDVALAQAIKHRPDPLAPAIWLGLSTTTLSLRRYHRLAEIWRMVARTADAQLGHSLVLLLATVLGMAVVYLVPPLALLTWPLHGSVATAVLGALGWLLMTAAYAPTARLYRLPSPWLATLPSAAALYVAMTIGSALAYRCGVGGSWKGRMAAHASASARAGGQGER